MATEHEVSLALKLAYDVFLDVENVIESDVLPELLSKGNTNSLSGTAQKMKSTAKANRLTQDTDHRIDEVLKRCSQLSDSSPNASLADGTTPDILCARALVARARLIELVVSAMNFVKRKKAYREAIDALEQSIGLHPNQEAYLHLGICNTRLKEKATAIAAFRKCIELDADSDQALEAAKNLRKLGQM